MFLAFLVVVFVAALILCSVLYFSRVSAKALIRAELDQVEAAEAKTAAEMDARMEAAAAKAAAKL